MGARTSKKKPIKLAPVDLNRCQAEKPSGHTFMTLGGVPGMVRCRNKPTVIVTEHKQGEDGQCGRMSLCSDCFVVFCTEVLELDTHSFEEITDKGAPRSRARVTP